MPIVIAGVLDAEQVLELRDLLTNAAFSDGRSTAGWSARLVKHNEQAMADPALDMWRDSIAAALIAHPVFQIAVYPKRIIGPMFSRYKEGDAYGAHVDEPIMDGARIDLSYTVFLSDPSSYAGGELTIDTPGGVETHKHAAGSAVVYPATSLHNVAPVTHGERYAAIGWIRSYIQDRSRRELLFDLETARRLHFEAHGKTPELDLLSKCHANLIRMWAQD